MTRQFTTTRIPSDQPSVFLLTITQERHSVDQDGYERWWDAKHEHLVFESLLDARQFAYDWTTDVEKNTSNNVEVILEHHLDRCRQAYALHPDRAMPNIEILFKNKNGGLYKRLTISDESVTPTPFFTDSKTDEQQQLIYKATMNDEVKQGETDHD
tara:strand:+ start:1230 stop:1697 length:468 start_codon:yes stop_codon:yes gene_type:complete